MAGPLIDVDRLHARLDDPTLRIVDVRWYLANPEGGRLEYDRGHIPGAVFCDLETDLTGEEGSGRHPLPPPERFTETLGRLGIKPTDTVVGYDDAGGATAARLWWMLRSIDHDASLVLDGGWQAWKEAGYPIQTETPEIEPTRYPPAESWRGVVNAEEVRARLGTTPVVDARAEERYRGETEPIDPKAGHIPTAVNLPFAGNLDPAGRLLSPAELRRRYQQVSGPETVVYCGSGVTACHDILAMRVAGFPTPLLYEGSWSDWSAHDLPLATGDEPGEV